MQRLDSLKNNDLVFEYTADQNYNRQLKTIKVKRDGKRFVSHLARHTFGTNLAKETGNIFTEMRCMGINKTETALIYINMVQNNPLPTEKPK